MSCAIIAPALGRQVEITMEEDKRKDPIVVYGQSTRQTMDSLEDCIARNCLPDEEIAAALAHAENQFLEGEYKDARATILETIDRNRKYREKYPVSVSNLYRSHSKVAEHLGEAREYKFAVLEMREALQKGLVENHPRILLADLEVGDSRAKLGYPDEARRIYTRTQKKAMKLDRPDLATLARLRGLLLTTQTAAATKEEWRLGKAREELDDFINNPIPGAEKFAIVGKILRARMDRVSGDASSTDDIIQEYTDLGNSGRPLLLYSEPIELDNRNSERSKAGGNILNQLAVDNFNNRWVDIGFWINADGKVGDIEVLRSSGSLEWVKYVERSIKSRVYAPLKKSNDDPEPDIYSIERYSFTSRYEKRTGTRIRQRQAMPRIERLDLTPDPPVPSDGGVED